MLTVAQVAQVKGCTPQYVRALIAKGKLEHVLDGDPRNHIRQYLVPVTALPEKLQAKYYGRAAPPKTEAITAPQEPPKPLDAYSDEERREIELWIGIVQEWKTYRIGRDRKVADGAFVAQMRQRKPELSISTDVLYRRWKAWRDQHYDGLIDRRGKWRKGRYAMDETVWECFLSYWFDLRKYPMKQCIHYTQLWCEQEHPELLAGIPSYSAFYRRWKAEIPEALNVLGREGDKVFDDRCGPYLPRIYDDMASNDFWIADNHTFDIISEGENGTRHRLYLTAFMDARSGIITGFHITDNPSSEATIYALRAGILQYGIPKYIYVDNGREFLTYDVGGLGHRRKKKSADTFSPPPIFARLGITMINAQVRNARAKIIERRFLDFKNQISRLFMTFTGGNVLEKPANLKHVLKAGHVPADHRLREVVGQLLEGYFNEQPYNGSVAADKGKNRKDVYYDHLEEKRVASADDLTLMLMRSTRLQKVGRMGVHLTIGGFRIDYRDDAFCLRYQGEQVYVRYDPENISSVRVYDEQDRFIAVLQANSNIISGYVTSKEVAKESISKIKSAKKLARQEIKSRVLASMDQVDALDLVLGDAQRNIAARMENGEPDRSVLQIHRVSEEPLMPPRVVNGALPLDTMLKNAENAQRASQHKDI
ncbi:Mu transposase C-terminal domain-containing protein [Ethanoligenens harbinense]|uniref:Mu transposase C-terminal domain-containing protein n=1 Tax=Ethanoligenens harbinense TaxID=253239 RepID=UPI000D137F1A|nr:Mu transposase C-terminal domain-containing protein [Ethanoligenens harbinense]AVQ95243.1 transposase [Ethanoligenens harbinense YUAN-3]AYF37934.1 transposase [Ethanoligenens harbinense]AYF40654.1 transposase [Ethanoligenens harbinense]QCN91488.1 transposase [Ethanoligenens harbinense]